MELVGLLASRINDVCDELREASLFMGWGGRPTAEIAITLANHLIFASFLQSILLGP